MAQARLRARLIAGRVAEAHGCTAGMEWTEGYPSVANDPALTKRAEDIIVARFGTERIQSIGAIMPGEDSSYFKEGRPGFFVELSARNPALGCDLPHHNPRRRMDEGALIFGLQYQFNLVRALLEGTRDFEGTVR